MGVFLFVLGLVLDEIATRFHSAHHSLIWGLTAGEILADLLAMMVERDAKRDEETVAMLERQV